VHILLFFRWRGKAPIKQALIHVSIFDTMFSSFLQAKGLNYIIPGFYLQKLFKNWIHWIQKRKGL